MWFWLISGFLFTGCIKRNRPPCWVSQPCKPYRAELYILGVGKSQNKKMAADEAIASLSNRFQLKQSDDANWGHMGNHRKQKPHQLGKPLTLSSSASNRRIVQPPDVHQYPEATKHWCPIHIPSL